MADMSDVQLLDDQLQPITSGDQLRVGDRVYVNGRPCRVAAVEQRDGVGEATFYAEPVELR